METVTGQLFAKPIHHRLPVGHTLYLIDKIEGGTTDVISFVNHILTCTSQPDGLSELGFRALHILLDFLKNIISVNHLLTAVSTWCEQTNAVRIHSFDRATLRNQFI